MTQEQNATDLIENIFANRAGSKLRSVSTSQNGSPVKKETFYDRSGGASGCGTQKIKDSNNAHDSSKSPHMGSYSHNLHHKNGVNEPVLIRIPTGAQAITTKSILDLHAAKTPKTSPSKQKGREGGNVSHKDFAGPGSSFLSEDVPERTSTASRFSRPFLRGRTISAISTKSTGQLDKNNKAATVGTKTTDSAVLQSANLLASPDFPETPLNLTESRHSQFFNLIDAVDPGREEDLDVARAQAYPQAESGPSPQKQDIPIIVSQDRGSDVGTKWIMNPNSAVSSVISSPSRGKMAARQGVDNTIKDSFEDSEVPNETTQESRETLLNKSEALAAGASLDEYAEQDDSRIRNLRSRGLIPDFSVKSSLPLDES